MVLRTCFVSGFCLVATAGVCGEPLAAPAVPAADFYVAVDGNDQWSGTSAAPNAQHTDGPFATLERARDAVRAARAGEQWQRPLVVMLGGGTYRRAAPFVLRPEDSGREISPVVYEAYPDETPVITWSWGYYAENVFEGLATPGSWYLDRKKGVLFYHPLPGEDMHEAEVVAPAAEQLVRLEGNARQGKCVRHVTLRGLRFEHTTWPLPQGGHVCVQAEITPPAAIHADAAMDCRIEQCQLAHLGAWGVEFRRGCRDNAVVSSVMQDLGAGCVKIGEPTNAASDADETRQTLVSDNRFLDAGQVFLGSAAVWIGQSSRNTISHNEITGPLMWAVSAGWTWSYFPLQRARDNVIEFNHAHHIGTGILGAHCAIYALGTSPGTVIRNNYIHHVGHADAWRGAGEGIILDNGCCGILVENNVVHDAVAGGFGTNFNCFGNIVLNNIFAYGREYQLTVYGDAPTGAPQPKGELFARNLVVWRDGPLIKEADWPSFSTLWDYNLYFREGGQKPGFPVPWEIHHGQAPAARQRSAAAGTGACLANVNGPFTT